MTITSGIETWVSSCNNERFWIKRIKGVGELITKVVKVFPKNQMTIAN